MGFLWNPKAPTPLDWCNTDGCHVCPPLDTELGLSASSPRSPMWPISLIHQQVGSYKHWSVLPRYKGRGDSVSFATGLFLAKLTPSLPRTLYSKPSKAPWNKKKKPRPWRETRVLIHRQVRPSLAFLHSVFKPSRLDEAAWRDKRQTLKWFPLHGRRVSVLLNAAGGGFKHHQNCLHSACE
jgi:hypothetical protein